MASHLAKLLLVAALVITAFAYTVPAFGQSTVVLTVNTQYSTGQPISGLWTTLARNGQVVASGFSPIQFNLASGQQYVVTVGNYQSFIFERWQDTGSTSASRAVSISQGTTITALYQAPAGTGTSPVVHMSDTTATSGSLVQTGRRINAEWVKPGSQLIGDKIDSITLRLARTATIPPGTFSVGVYDANLNLKRSFGTVSASTLTTAYQDVEFKLPASDPLYTIAQDDRIGLFYNGGSASVGINVMIDRNSADPFDGTNSQRVRYESGWLYYDTGEDLYMILRQTQSGSVPPPGNSRPTANGQSVSVNENSARTITLSGSDPDGQQVRFFIAGQPAHGILGMVNQNTVTYRPYDYYDGPDSFTFVASDGALDSTPATVNISVANTVAKTTSQAVVITVDPRGHTDSGFWTTLSQNGVQINADFSHVAFNVNNGQQYVVGATPGFGQKVFDRWQDTGSTNPSRAISITKDTPLIAVYR
ncbi:MAG: Ig-like domain-containing protein [Nitrososphaera sp.]|uniref:Ig-like domain-containing protein n=1 Tax=Nitrososphaera sp. TaxID=1971748 RepID=UPI003D6F990A